jgi:hypothetical protein
MSSKCPFFNISFFFGDKKSLGATKAFVQYCSVLPRQAHGGEFAIFIADHVNEVHSVFEARERWEHTQYLRCLSSQKQLLHIDGEGTNDC